LAKREKEINALMEDNKLLQNKFAQSKQTILAHELTIHQMQTNIIDIQEECNKLRLEIIGKDKELFASCAKLRQMDELCAELNKQSTINGKLETQYNTLLIEKKSLQSKVVDIGKQNSQLNETIIKNQREIASLEARTSADTRTISSRDEQIISLGTQIKLLEAKISQLLEPDTLRTLGGDISSMNTESSEYSKIVYEELREKEEEIKTMKQNIEAITKENIKLKSQYEQVKLKMMNLFVN
jgi:chromosome segregation ATPase